MKMIGIYARQSIEKQNSISIDQQIEFCKSRIDSNASVEVYSDAGFSGKNTARPAFQRLLADIKCGLITKVICYRIDRISRNLLDFANVWELLQRYKVEFVSVSEQFDTTTPMGKAMIYIAMVFAQMERETISQRITDNYYTRTAHGAWGGGPAPYGFKKSRGMLNGKMQSLLKPVPEQQEHIKYMFEAYATGLTSLAKIADEMKKRDCETDRMWTNVSVKRILNNPIYAAADADLYAFYAATSINIVSPLPAWDGSHSALQNGSRASSSRERRPMNEQKLSVFSVPPIVPSSTFIQVQQLLNKNQQIKNSHKSHWSWLSGLLKCGNCGYSCTLYHSGTTKRTKAYIRCSGRYNNKICKITHTETIESVEEYVFNQLKQHLEDVKPTISEKADSSPGTNRLKLKLLDIQQKQQNAARAIAEGGSAVMRLMLPEIERLDAEAEKVTAEMNKIATAETKAWMPEMYFDLDALDEKSLRDVARITIDKIIVSPDKPPEIVYK